MDTEIQSELLAEIKKLSNLLAQSPSIDDSLDIIAGIDELKNELLCSITEDDQENDDELDISMPVLGILNTQNRILSSSSYPNKKLAVIVGHTRTSPGAYGVSPINSCEYFWNSEIANRMVQIAPARGINCAAFYRDAGTAVAYRKADAWGADSIIELHYNSASPRATGIETLWANKNSVKWAKIVQKHMVKLLGLRDRGLVDRSGGGRGCYNLMLSRKPSVIVEPFFGSNAGDVKIASRNKLTLAKVYLDAFDEFVSA